MRKNYHQTQRNRCEEIFFAETVLSKRRKCGVIGKFN